MPTYIVEVKTEVTTQYTVKAPSAKAAMLPVETLRENWPHFTRRVESKIVNVTKQTQDGSR